MLEDIFLYFVSAPWAHASSELKMTSMIKPARPSNSPGKFALMIGLMVHHLLLLHPLPTHDKDGDTDDAKPTYYMMTACRKSITTCRRYGRLSSTLPTFAATSAASPDAQYVVALAVQGA